MPDDDIPEVRPVDDGDRPRRRRDRDDRDRPRRVRSNDIAIIALILGLGSVFFACLTGLPAIVCGSIGMTRARDRGTGSGTALAGIILGGFFSVFGLLSLVGLVLPAVQAVRQTATRIKTQKKFNEISLATGNHESATGAFPADVIDADPTVRGRAWTPDKPLPRLTASWRAGLLPYLAPDPDRKPFDLTQPWDARENAATSGAVVPQFLLGNDPATPNTRIRGLIGVGTLHDPNGRFGRGDITDGTSNTIYAIDFPDPVRWAEPNDYRYDVTWDNAQNPPPVPAIGGGMDAPAVVLMADGSVRVIYPKKVSPAVFRALVGRNDADVIDGAAFDRD